MGAVHDELDDRVGEALDDHVGQQPPELGLGWPVGVSVVFGAEEPEEDRQPDRPSAEARQLDDEHDDDPAVAPPGSPTGALGLGAVVQVVRAPHAPPRATEQRVIDGQTDRRAGLDEHRHQEVGQPQADIVGLPARAGEEVVRAAVMPRPGQARGLQHPRDRAVADPPDEPDQQHAERLKRRLREARPKQGQHPGKRSGHGGDSRCRAAGTSEATRGQIGLTPTGFGVAAPPPCPARSAKPAAARASAAALGSGLAYGAWLTYTRSTASSMRPASATTTTRACA
jgi:hypothetical protein